MAANDEGVVEAELDLDRDIFLRTLVRELSGVLERTVGLPDAEGFMSAVGRRIGAWIDGDYRTALGTDRLDRTQVADVLTDLKRRIGGSFDLVEETPSTLTYHNADCPFGDKVLDRQSMCMMTSNVFGVVAADNLGYARVELEETIAQGDGRCVVRVHLDRGDLGATVGREYFGLDDDRVVAAPPAGRAPGHDERPDDGPADG